MNPTIPTLIVFDVNETLLDMTGVKNKVNKALGSKWAFKIWFGLLLQYALVDTVTGKFHDFGTIAKTTLSMEAASLEADLTDKDIQDILETL